MLGPVLKIIPLHWLAAMQNFHQDAIGKASPPPRQKQRSLGRDKGLCPHHSAQQASDWFMTDRSAGGGHWAASMQEHTHTHTRHMHTLFCTALTVDSVIMRVIG